MGEIGLRPLALALRLPYPTLYRWARSGTIHTHLRDAGGKNFLTFDVNQAVEAAALVRLRRAGVPFTRLRRAAEVLRSRGVAGARWLALREAGRDVLLRDKAELVGVLDGQVWMALLDLDAIRADVRRIEAATRAS